MQLSGSRQSTVDSRQIGRTLVVVGMLVSTGALAEVPVRVDSRGSIYQDTDRTFIGTTTVAASATAAERVTVTGRYLIDVISSASVDVISAATTRFEENRHEAEGALAYGDGERTLSASYVYSTEIDWSSHTVNLGASHDFLQHNLTLAGGYGRVRNRVGRAHDPHFVRQLDVDGGSLSLTTTPSPASLAQVTASVSWVRGYQASPYRFVFVGTDGLSFPETHPDERLRASLTLRYHRHMFGDTALQTHARAYQDSWGVRSATAGAEVIVGFGELALGVRARGYGQLPARFYRQSYDAPMRFLSSDRELGTFTDVFAGARLEWRRKMKGPLRELRAEAKAEGFGFWFYDFAPLASRAGVIGEIALGGAL